MRHEVRFQLIQIAWPMMDAKVKITMTLSLSALCLSGYATIATERKSFDERQRTIRGQLTDALGEKNYPHQIDRKTHRPTN